MPSGDELEAAGAVIGEIHVIVGDIFDPSIPSEDKWLYRTANKLHINTRPSVIRDQLLFKTGEPYVQRLVEETERILRANDYMYDAWIRPVAYDGKTVDLEVRTRDTWTLNPGINFSRQGGANSSSITLEEKNLLGNGQKLAFGWTNDVDRESYDFEFFDPHFHSTWTRFGVVYSDADDGSTKALRVDRPFYSLDTIVQAAATCTIRSARSLATPWAMKSASSRTTSSSPNSITAGRTAGRKAGCAGGRQA